MSSTDETQGEDVYGVDSGGTSQAGDAAQADEFAPPRRRRSTYTPPPQYREAVLPLETEPIAPPRSASTESSASAPMQAAPSRPAPVEPAPADPAPVEPELPRPSYAVYSIDDGSLDSIPGDGAPVTPPVALPVWTPPVGQTAPVAPAPPVMPTQTPAAQTPVWTPPVDETPAQTTAIPDWSTQAPVAGANEFAGQPLAPPPAWTRPPEPVDLPIEQPVEQPVEPTSPYRAWTPDSHVDADAYWNTAQRATIDPVPPAPVQPIQFVPAPVEPVVEATNAAPEPLPSAPVWSLDDDANVAPQRAPEPLPTDDRPPVAESSGDRYRPWQPEPQPETTPLWEALFPSNPPAAPPAAPSVWTAAEATPPLQPEPTQPADAEPSAPAYMSPDDEAATLAAHAPPAGQPWIPQRRSLPDDQLLTVLEAADSKPGGTLDAMDALENEMRLREEEVQEYREWEDSMLAVGTPEALAVVAQVRPEFTAITIPIELEPTPTSAIPIQYPTDEGASDASSIAEEPGDDDVSHDMPQSWFDALATPIEPALIESAPIEQPPAAQPPTAATPGFVAQPTGYPVPKFDDLLTHAPPEQTIEEPADAAPKEKTKRPFGVAVADGEPQTLAPVVAAEVAPKRARTPLFALEQAGERPTPRDLRTGRASRMFWLWFAANSSVVSIGMGAMIFTLGMSLRQSIVATLAGVGLSFIPLGLGTLAGKRSGQPTMIVSRAVFGLFGNVVPAALAFVSRVFWGSVLLWLFAASIAAVIGGNVGGATGSTAGLVVVFIVVGVMLAVVVAFLGYWLLARVQLVVSIISAALIVGFVALTWQHIDLRAALTVADGPWILVVTGAVVVFSFLGLVWANSASDLARYQQPSSSGATTMLWSGFGATLPSLLLVAYGALLAASDATLGAQIVADPVGALSGILPGWYPIPLVIATGLSLLSGVVITTYSGAFALQSIGVRVERQWATLLVGALLAVVAVGFSVLDVDLVGVFRDLATTIAVPVAAWAGIFAADTMIRNRPFHTASLLRIGGVYPTVNWITLPALVLITAIGWGLTTATVSGLGWQGYLFQLAGIDRVSDLAASDLGVLAALVLGLLTPIVSQIPAIRRQEAAGRPI